MTIRKIVRTQEEESDHTLLLTLNAKVDSLTTSVDRMNDGIRTRMRELEIKVNKHDTIVDKVDPIGTHTKFLDLEKQVSYIKFTLYLIGVLGTIILWITGVFSNIISIVKKL